MKDVKCFIKNKIIIIQKNTKQYKLHLFKQITEQSYRLKMSCLKNIIFGLRNFFTLRLVLVGVGYRVESVTKNMLKLKIGFSHFVYVPIPEDTQAFVVKRNVLILKSPNLVGLTQFAERIRKEKFPDSYKGKGVLFKNEKVQLKEGKKK